MPFEQDIFISYTHADNHAAPGAKGWVDQFHEELEAWCIRRFGRQHRIRIWRDERLDANQIFTDEIKHRLENSFLVLALNSTNFAASEFCRDELKWFRDHAAKSPPGLRLPKGNHSRILNILLRNIPYEEWPPELEGAGAFRMHDEAAPGDFGDPTPPESCRFTDQLKAIVNVVEKLINTHLLKPVVRPPSPAAPSRPVVLLAATADSLSKQQRRLETELAKLPVELVRAGPPPYESAAHARAVESALAACSLSVHPLDASAGAAIADGTDDLTYPQVQAEMAMAAKTPQIIWLPTRVEPDKITDASQAGFLRKICDFQTQAKPFRITEGHVDDLVSEIRGLLRIDAPNQPRREAPSQVLIDTNLKDQIFAAQLWMLLEQAKIRCLINQERESADERIAGLEDNLRAVKIFVIVCGTIPYDRASERLKHCVKFRMTHGREHVPLRNFFAFLPHKSQFPTEQLAREFEFLHLGVLDQRDSEQVHPDSLQPVIQAAAGS